MACLYVADKSQFVLGSAMQELSAHVIKILCRNQGTCHNQSLCYLWLPLQGETKCELFDAKHESHLLHLDGQLSYDPKPYGVDHACRFRIKTMQVSAFLWNVPLATLAMTSML